MEVRNLPNIATQKAEESQKVKAPARTAVNAYATTNTQDSVDVSPKARLLLNLRESYDKIPQKEQATVEQIKEKMDKGTPTLSSEEIVASILKGTFFEVI